MPPKEAKNRLRDRVEAALKDVRALLAMHGGDVELVAVEEGIASVRLTGACHGCPLAAMTLRMGVERMVRERVPEIAAVRAVGDGGTGGI